MVQVQSTWFPLYDRNPQLWMRNMFKAKPTDYKAQTHRVCHTAAHPSRIEVYRAEVSSLSHPERSEGGMPERTPPSLRSG